MQSRRGRASGQRVRVGPHPYRELRPVAHVNSMHQQRDVLLYRVQAEVQSIGDFFIELPARDPCGYFALAGRENNLWKSGGGGLRLSRLVRGDDHMLRRLRASGLG